MFKYTIKNLTYIKTIKANSQKKTDWKILGRQNKHIDNKVIMLMLHVRPNFKLGVFTVDHIKNSGTCEFIIGIV